MARSSRPSSSSSSSSSNRWRYLNPSYYLKRLKRLAILFIAFVSISFFVWDRQTLTREHEVEINKLNEELTRLQDQFGDGGDFIGKSIKNDSVKDDPLDIQRREKVKEAMLHAWTSYETYAWGQDELQFRNITEVESLKSICNGEIKRRESLEFTCNSLKIDNERLVKAYTESFNKMVDQIEGRSKCVNLKEELKKLTEERAIKEEGHRKALELLKQEDEKKIGELERQVRCALVQQTANEAMVNQLNQDLAEHKAHIEFLNTRLERVHADVKSKYHMELEDLKDWLLVEQEEKRELIKKLQSAEKELLMFRKKLEEQQRDSTSNRHFETLKQKIMELRNKNEVLKRQLNSEDSKFLSWLTRRRHPKTIATTKMRLTKWWKNMFLRFYKK